MIHSVDLYRELRNSPNGRTLVGHIPEIECDDREKVIAIPEVCELINATYGRRIIIEVNSSEFADFLQYEIFKETAII